MFPFTQYEKQGCLNLIFLSGQIKKIPVFRINQPYLNLLVKQGIFSGFLEKNIILCISKGILPFKMHKILFFPEKNCVPTLPKIFHPVTQNTLIFYLALPVLA